DFSSHFDNFAGPIEPERRSDGPVASAPFRCGEVGPVKAGRLDLDQKFKRLGLGLRNVTNLDPVFRRHSRLHRRVSPCWMRDNLTSPIDRSNEAFAASVKLSE